MHLSRRDVLKVGAFGGAALLLPLERTVRAAPATPPRLAASRLPKPFTIPFAVPPVLQPWRVDDTTDFYKVYMQPFQAEIVPGLRTPLWGYNGSYPGPTVRASQGRPTVIRHVNNLPEQHPTLRYTPWTSVHLHGSPSLTPSTTATQATSRIPGSTRTTTTRTRRPAGRSGTTTTGSPHRRERADGAGRQYHLYDPLERSLPIPHGEYDLPLILSDAMFKPDGSLLFDNHD